MLPENRPPRGARIGRKIHPVSATRQSLADLTLGEGAARRRAGSRGTCRIPETACLRARLGKSVLLRKSVLLGKGVLLGKSVLNVKRLPSRDSE